MCWRSTRSARRRQIITPPTGLIVFFLFLSLLGIALDYYLLTARRPFLVSGLLCMAAVLLGGVLLAVGPRVAGLILAGIGTLGGLLSLVGEYVQHIYRLVQNAPFYELHGLGAPSRADRCGVLATGTAAGNGVYSRAPSVRCAQSVAVHCARPTAGTQGEPAAAAAWAYDRPDSSTMSYRMASGHHAQTRRPQARRFLDRGAPQQHVVVCAAARQPLAASNRNRLSRYIAHHVLDIEPRRVLTRRL